MKTINIALLFMMILSTSCASLMGSRSFMSEMESPTNSLFVPGKDFPVMPGDSGKVGSTSEEIDRRTPKTYKQMQRYRERRSISHELTQKEQKLDEREYRLYARYRDMIGSKSSRLYYLNLTPAERREYLTNLGFTSPTRSRGRSIASFAFSGMKQESPLYMGMTKNEVMSTWGRPTRVDVAGNIANQNERWQFQRNNSVNYVYFEAGRVNGWQLD